MFTIGTSGLLKLAASADTPQIVKDALVGKLVGFVGTQLERTGDGADISPTFLTSTVIYFQTSSIVTNHDCTVWRGDPLQGNKPERWVQVGTATVTIPYETLSSASGYLQAIYAFPRGDADGRNNVSKIAGLPYWNLVDHELSICNGSTWTTLSGGGGSGGSVSVGIMCIFAESVALNKLADPSKWLRCDGSAKLKNSYPELYEVCRDAFGPETDTTFTIPIMNNTIVRARQ